MTNNAAKIVFCLTKNNLLVAKQHFLNKPTLKWLIIGVLFLLLCQRTGT